jgi:hypothetical protein
MLGILGSAIVITISLLFAVAMSPEAVTGWIGFALTAMVPALIVLTPVWQSQLQLHQPLRGIVSLMVNAVIGAVVVAGSIVSFGGGYAQPTPFVIMPLIVTVPLTLGQIFLFDCWPFAKLTTSRAMVGLMVLAASYGLAAIVDRLFFDFGFLRAAPFYHTDLDPNGLFDARTTVAFAVASVGGVLALAALDFWPVTKLAGLLPIFQRQPYRGLLNLGVVILTSAALWAFFVIWARMDVATFQAHVCVSFIFGMFILLVMLQGRVFPDWPQPIRGLVVIGLAILIAGAAYSLYAKAAVRLGGVADLPPSPDLQSWVSTAMLAITFPGMGVFADLFEFWPLRSQQR